MSGHQEPTRKLYDSPFSAGQIRENKTENNLKVEVRPFTKAKAKVALAQAKKKHKNFFPLLLITK